MDERPHKRPRLGGYDGSVAIDHPIVAISSALGSGIDTPFFPPDFDFNQGCQSQLGSFSGPQVLSDNAGWFTTDAIPGTTVSFENNLLALSNEASFGHPFGPERSLPTTISGDGGNQYDRSNISCGDEHSLSEEHSSYTSMVMCFGMVKILWTFGLYFS